jgi:hypothetical protein
MLRTRDFRSGIPRLRETFEVGRETLFLEVIMVRFAKMVMAMAIIVASPAFVNQATAEVKKPTPVEGARFDTTFPLKENLNTFMGKDVHLLLRSGQTVQGYVKSVGDHFLHLEKLAGRDFYDALVRIDDISAIEAKFRDLK